MHYVRTPFAIAGIAALIAVGISCSGSAPVAGWGSETTNGVTAAVLRSDGSPAQGATVRLRRADFVAQPPSLAKTGIRGADAITDDSGRFEILGIDTGAYRIEVTDTSTDAGHGGAVLFACPVDIGDTLDLGIGTLRPYATIAGTLDTVGRAGQSGYVQVVGLERLAAIDASGRFVLGHLPAGTFSIRAITSANIAIASTSGITVGPGERTNVIIPGGWRFSKRLYLNTTAAGANVSDTVTAFPLLVRLQSAALGSTQAAAIFFSQARHSGEDLRFAKPDGTPLRYEIDTWDSTAAVAAAWVLLDTVWGNASSHYIVLSWGNDTCRSLSEGSAVFDTANGFQGVWHLGQAASPSEPDATGNHFDGTLYGMTGASVPGAIGTAQQFNGSTSYIEMTGTADSRLNFSENGNYTLSAWVYTERIDTTYQSIVSKSNQQYGLQVDNERNWQFFEFHAKQGWNSTGKPATAQSWTCVAGVRSGTEQYLYVNGELIDSTITITADASDRITSDNVYIGRRVANDSRWFNGMIDEVRISDRPIGPGWMKLCYMNQKQNDALIDFR